MPRILALLIAGTVLGGCAQDVRNTGAAAETPGRFSEGKFILYRLDGDRYPDVHGLDEDRDADDSELLHGWHILAKCSIESVDDRNRLFTALEEGEADHRRDPGLPVDCFRPRHAIRFVDDGTTTDRLICFECRNIMIWTDGELTGGGSTSDRPAAVFESYLEDCAPSR